MADNEILQAILKSVEGFNSRFTGIEGQLSSLTTGLATVDARVEAIATHIVAMDTRIEVTDTRIASMDTRIDSIGTHIASIDMRLAAVEDRLSIMDGRASTVEIRLSNMDNRFANIEQVVTDLYRDLKSWPDMHYLAAAATTLIGHTRDLKAEVSSIKTRMNEIYQSMATDPEIRGLREDVSSFRDQSVTLEIRIETIERHLGLKREPALR